MALEPASGWGMLVAAWVGRNSRIGTGEAVSVGSGSEVKVPAGIAGISGVAAFCSKLGVPLGEAVSCLVVEKVDAVGNGESVTRPGVQVGNMVNSNNDQRIRERMGRLYS